MPGLLVYLDIRNAAAELGLVIFNRNVAILIIGRNAESRACNNIFGVARDERRSVVTAGVGQLNDFGCAECF